MNLGDILKTVGSGLIKTLVPGGGLLIDAVNGFLPDDKKLPNDATGQDAQNAINTLTPEQKASVLNKEYDVEIEEIRGFTDRFKAMAEVDASGNTTRPQIAKMMAQVVCFTIIVIVSMYAFAITSHDAEMIRAINEGWPMLTAIIATPTALLRAYFAMRTKEKQHKYEAATGVKPQANLISALIGRFK